MGKFKDKIYNYLVRRNKRVQYEYERYVQEHLVEHYESRFRHWKILWKLNWHYRVKEKSGPLLYWDQQDVIEQGHKKSSEQIDRKQDIQNKVAQNNKSVNSSINTKSSMKMRSMNYEGELKHACSESQIHTRLSVADMVEKLKKYDIISFDMFDTLIFRALDGPTNLFWLIGNELFVPNFKKIRVEVEKELRENCNGGEITIDDIYSVIQNRLGIDKNKGIATELKYELAVCQKNPYMYEVYKQLLSMGKKIIVTSNMYLNSEQLKKILNNCSYNIDDVFVSCEYNMSKKIGALQSKITELYGGDKTYIHVGDNYFMDIEGSRIAGWQTLYYQNISKLGNKYRPQNMSTVSGNVYKALVNQKVHCGKNLDPYYEYGYAYVGYLVYGFCKWLDDLAAMKKIDKFLFVSRDMKVVYQVYKKIFNNTDADYIKASRTSSIHLSFERHIEHFCDWHIKRRVSSKIPMSQVLEELEYEFLIDKLSDYDLIPNEILTNENLARFKNLIYDNKKAILKNYEGEKRAALKYYSDIIGNAKNICIIDMGWKASTFNSLKDFLINENHMDIGLCSAMLGMEGHDYVDNLMCVGDVYTYVFSNHDNLDLMETHNLNGNIWRRIYEMVFTSNELSLLKFISNGENVDFKFLRKENRVDFIVTNMHQGIVDFATDYSDVEKNLEIDLVIPSRDAYKPLQNIMFNKDLHMKLFDEFEVCFIAGNVKENNMELFRDVLNKGGK